MTKTVVPALRAARSATSTALLLVSAAASAASFGVKIPAGGTSGHFGYVTEIPRAAVPSAFLAAQQPGISAPASASLPPAAAPLSAPAPAPSPAAVGQAIAGAQSVDEALAAVVKTGALSADKVPQDPTDRLFALKRMWDHAAPAYADGKISVDAGWAVPALRVESAGTTYLIHPVAHGQLYPPNRRAVTKLARQIEAAGHALYSEQELPTHYGFAFGKETTDHAVNRGEPVTVRPAAGGVPDAALRAIFRLFTAAALTPLALAAPQILQHPSAMTIVPAALYAAALAVLRTGLLPFYRYEEWRRSREAAKLGAGEMAEQFAREASALHRARVEPMEVLRLHLPPGPGADSDRFAARSKAMAEAVAQDAKAVGAKVVHLLVGYRHAADIGWRLRSQLP